ncbi:MAG: TonB-dependent receptor plug domain-containing protein, partial [Gemmatimonadota bacterium]
LVKAFYRVLFTAALLAPVCPSTIANAQDPPPIFALDTLRVEVGSLASGAFPSATRAVEVVTAERIAQLPARTVADVLRTAFGVDVRRRSPAQADLSIRGGTFEQVLVLVDGKRVSDVQTGHFDLDVAIPLDAIERIEVLRGPASSLYGTDAVGGVVNIVTRDARGSGVATRIDGGSFGTAGVTADARMGDAGLGLSTSTEYRRSDGHRDGTDYEITKARAALAADAGPGALDADVAVAARDFGAAEFYGPFPSYEETRTLRASLAWRPAEVDDGLTVEPRLSARRHHDDFVLMRDDPAFYRNIHTSWQVGGSLIARHPIGDAARLAAGAEVYADRLESSNLGDRSERRGAAFIELAAGRVGHAALTAGLRADRHSEYEGFVAPSVAGAIWPADRLRLRASYGRAFRAPTWTERYYTDPTNTGDPDLAPERSSTAELGIDVFASPRFRIAVGGFLRRSDALIDWARPADEPDSVVFQAMNIEDATFQGLELEASVDGWLGIDWLGRISAVAFEADEADGFTSRYVLRPLTHEISLEAAAPLPGDARVRLHARRARRDGEARYHSLDVRLTRAWRHVRLFIDGLNLTDASYLDASAVPAAGRAVLVGAEWSGDLGS